VTTARPGDGIRVEAVAMEDLAASGRAEPSEEGRIKRIASCGVPLPGTVIRIRAPERHDLSDRTVGEIQVRAQSVMRGYVGRDAPDPFEDGWLRTRDRGYTVNGELFVTGRVKELIISYGRTYNPEDIEWAASLLPEVRMGRVVALAPQDDPDGDLIVAFEPTSEEETQDLSRRVRRAVANATGLTRDR
jgi:fatty-acyl-CoA synthase